MFPRTNQKAKLNLAAFLKCSTLDKNSRWGRSCSRIAWRKKSVLSFFSNSESTRKWMQKMDSFLFLSQTYFLEDYRYQIWIPLIQFHADSTNVFVALKWQNLHPSKFYICKRCLLARLILSAHFKVIQICLGRFANNGTMIVTILLPLNISSCVVQWSILSSLFHSFHK